MKIHQLSALNELDELRFHCIKMATLIIMSRKRPLITTSRKVINGRITYTELSFWYPKALILLDNNL